jgi:type I restriction enzyme, S subunit
MEENQVYIPEGWRKVALGKVLRYAQPYRFIVKSTNYDAKSGTPVLTAGKSFILGYTNETDNIYSETPVIIFDDFTTDTKFVDFPFKVKSSAMKFLKAVDEKEIDLKYAFEKIQTIKITETGGDHKRRWISEYSKIEVLLPEFTEQQSIANILSKTDQAIAHTEALIAKYSRIKTGLMQDLLTKGIDENGNIRSEQTHEFKDSPLGRIPKEWEVKNLLELTLKIGDGTHSSVKFSENDEVPFLFVSCIRPNRIDWNKMTSIGLDEYKKISKGKEPKKGTVLYSLVGSFGNAVTLNSDDKLSFQRHIGFIETKRDILLPEFLTLFFNSIYGNLQANDLAVGNAQKTITLGALSEFKILKPSIEEQNLIIEKVSIIEKHISQIETELAKLQSLKTGLMQDLLSGKVRVMVNGKLLMVNENQTPLTTNNQ